MIAKVYEVNALAVQIAVPEKEISDVQVGQPVRLRSRAYPSIEIQGKVAAIGAAAQGTSVPAAAGMGGAPTGTRMFLVTTHIDNQNLLLKPGMTGQAKILCGKRSIAGLITRRLTRTFKVEFWSWL